MSLRHVGAVPPVVALSRLCLPSAEPCRAARARSEKGGEEVAARDVAARAAVPPAPSSHAIRFASVSLHNADGRPLPMLSPARKRGLAYKGQSCAATPLRLYARLPPACPPRRQARADDTEVRYKQGCERME